MINSSAINYSNAIILIIKNIDNKISNESTYINNLKLNPVKQAIL